MIRFISIGSPLPAEGKTTENLKRPALFHHARCFHDCMSRSFVCHALLSMVPFALRGAPLLRFGCQLAELATTKSEKRGMGRLYYSLFWSLWSASRPLGVINALFWTTQPWKPSQGRFMWPHFSIVFKEFPTARSVRTATHRICQIWQNNSA